MLAENSIDGIVNSDISSVSISDAKIIKNITIENVKVDLFSILIENVEFAEGVSITFNNCVFSSIDITGSKLQFVILGSCSFKELNINNCSIENNLEIWDCDISDYLKINLLNINSKTTQLILNNCNISARCDFEIFAQNLKFQNNVISGTIEFKTLKIEDTFTLEGDGDITEMRIVGDHGSLSKLNYKLKGSIYLKIENLKIQHLSFYDIYVSNQSRIHLYHCCVSLLDFHKFKNDGFIEISELEPISDPQLSSKLSIENSILGNINFMGCNLSMFNTFIFKNSNILDCKFIWTPMPIPSIDDKQMQNSRKVFYSQLKSTFESTGDLVIANKFHAHELDSYYNELKWKDNCFTKIPLFISKWSNYYGENWVFALMGLIFFTIVFKNVFYFSIYRCNLLNNVIELDYYLISLIDAFNPIRDFQELMPGKPHIGAVSFGIDFIGRIITTFYIYQFIQAFRRYGNRSV